MKVNVRCEEGSYKFWMMIAEKLDIPFQFNPIVSKLEDLDFESLRVKTGEALAISSVLQIHTFLADDGVLAGPNFGVLRAESRGVSSSPSGSGIPVLI